MTGFPDVNVQVAFTSQATDTTPTWDELNTSCTGFETDRGREDADPEQFPPGTATVTLDGTEGEFDADNPDSPYDGYIRPNRQVRIIATVSTAHVLHTGFADSWRRTWPEGSDFSVTELASTDRFKLLARKSVTYSGSTEDADVRIDGLLTAAGVSSLDKVINDNADAARSLLMPSGGYVNENALSAVQDAARADGGQLFCNGEGSIVFQPVAYRQIGGATRARTSQVTFGNDEAAGTIPVEEDIDPTIDDGLMANRVLVGDGTSAGTVHVQEDTTAQTEDGLLELDLGATLLAATDAADRAADLLNLRKNPTPRCESVTVNLLTLAAADQEKVLGLEISDRVTVALIPPGATSGTKRDQWVESIAHKVEMGVSWLVTFGLSSAGDAVTVIP